MLHEQFGIRAALVLGLLACACGGTTVESGNPAGGNTAGAGNVGTGNTAGAGNAANSCPAFSACGGDLVGTWTIQQYCVNVPMDAISALCPGASIGLSTLDVSGTMTFGADNTVTSAGSVSFAENVKFPASCMTSAECTEYKAQLVAQGEDAQCSYDAAAGCSCAVNLSENPMASGTYQVQGSQLTVTDSSSSDAPEVDSFCVSGNTATLYQESNGVVGTMVMTR